MKVKRLSAKEMAAKEAIAEAAAKLFDRKGYLETSLADISKEAKLSKGGLYYYFGSKHEILFFVLDAYMDSLLDGLEGELERIPDPTEKVRHIALRHLQLYNSEVPQAKALLLDLPNLPPRYFRTIADKQKAYAEILAEVLGEYFDGQMPKFRAKALGYILFGMCNSVMHWHNPQGPIKFDELTDICFEIFLNGVAQYRSARGRHSAQVRSAMR